MVERQNCWTCENSFHVMTLHAEKKTADNEAKSVQD